MYVFIYIYTTSLVYESCICSTWPQFRPAAIASSALHWRDILFVKPTRTAAAASAAASAAAVAAAAVPLGRRMLFLHVLVGHSAWGESLIIRVWEMMYRCYL